MNLRFVGLKVAADKKCLEPRGQFDAHEDDELELSVADWSYERFPGDTEEDTMKDCFYVRPQGAAVQTLFRVPVGKCRFLSLLPFDSLPGPDGIRVTKDPSAPLTENSLRCRLDQLRLDRSKGHFPKPALTRGATCALHRFVQADGKYRKSIMKCPDCNINLCVFCYQMYHKVGSIVECKEMLQKMMPKKSKRKHAEV